MSIRSVSHNSLVIQLQEKGLKSTKVGAIYEILGSTLSLESVRRIISEMKYCPIFSENCTDKAFEFTVVPYRAISKVELVSDIHPSVLCLTEGVKNRNANENYAYSCAYDNLLKYSYFCNHFDLTKKAILKAAAGLKGSALIVGIGAANDIPLEAIAEQFEKVYVLDVDFTLLPKVLGRLPKELHSKIIAHQVDLSGYLGELTKKVSTLALKIKAGSFKKEDFWKEVGLIMPTLKRKSWDFPEAEGASLVVSSLVSSQLTNGTLQHIITVFCEITGESAPEKPPQIELDRADPAGFFNLVRQLEGGHVEDLYRWVAKKGCLYFADHFDTFFKATLSIDRKSLCTVEKERMLIAVEVVPPTLDRLFNANLLANWKWFQPESSDNPEGLNFKVFKITSCLLNPC